jgi:hypothetical protein
MEKGRFLANEFDDRGAAVAVLEDELHEALVRDEVGCPGSGAEGEDEREGSLTAPKTE